MGAVCNDKVHFSAGGHVFIAGKGGEGKDEINYHAKKQEEFEQGFHVRRTESFFLNSLSERALAWYSLIFNYSLLYIRARERGLPYSLFIYARTDSFFAQDFLELRNEVVGVSGTEHHQHVEVFFFNESREFFFFDESLGNARFDFIKDELARHARNG